MSLLPHELRLVYLGNLGLAHDVRRLAEFLRRCAVVRPVSITFIGTGVESPAVLKTGVAGHAVAVAREPHLPFARVAGELRSRAFHYGVVTLDGRFVGLVSPSKYIGYLVAGVPVIYLGAAQTNTALVCDRFRAGVRIDPACPPQQESSLVAQVLDEKFQEQCARNTAAALEYFLRFDGAYLASQILEKTGRGRRGA